MKPKINSLTDVPEWQLCCGCGVCAYLYPEMIEMVDIPATGRRPKFTAINNVDRLFKQGLGVCPGVNVKHPHQHYDKLDIIKSLVKSWGPVWEVWEAYAADPEIRYKGSSGGVITALGLYCLEQEKMNGVLHVASDRSKPFLNTTVLSKNKRSLLSGIGSRYSPASPCEKLAEVESSKGLNLIIGKPCDIAAVNNVRLFKEKLDSNIGLTIACFCAGTPSTNASLEMLRQMGVNDQNDLLSLRYRGYGWPGKTKAESKTKNNQNKYKELEYEESWGAILQEYRQWRCYICPDHTGEFADISVGDPWYKEATQDDPGRSLILIRSSIGRRILKSAIAKGYLVAERKHEKVLPASQANLKKARSRLWGQIITLKLLKIPCPSYSGFFLMQNWIDGLSLKEKLGSILGTAKRVYVKKLYKKQKVL